MLVYEVLAGGSIEGFYSFAAAAILKTVLIGGGIGVAVRLYRRLYNKKILAP